MDKKTSKIIIGAGLLVVAFGIFYFKKKEINKPTEKQEGKTNKSIVKFPKRFIDDVDRMSKNEIKATIEGNTQLLKDNKVTKQEKEAIESMLEYLKEKLK